MGVVWTADDLDSPERCRAFAAGADALGLEDAVLAERLNVAPSKVRAWRRLAAGDGRRRQVGQAPSLRLCYELAQLVRARVAELEAVAEQLEDENACRGKRGGGAPGRRLPRV